MKRWLSNLSLVAGALFAFLLLLEAALALLFPSKIIIQPYHEKYDPTLGWVNRPLKSEGVHFEFARNRFFHVTHNSLGLRGPETSYEKPQGSRRTLFVGDSYFWGYGVSDEQVVTSLLQKQLPSGIEVLNGGTSGYGTDQALLWLKNEGLKFRPDIVLFSFSAANDLDEIASSVSYNCPKPVFMLEDGAFVMRNVPVPRSEEVDRKTFGNPRTVFGRIKKFLRHNTHVYPFITGRLNSRPEIRRFMIGIGLAEEYSARLGNIPVLRNPPDQLWDIAISLIKESRRITEASGAKFVLLLIPDKEADASGRTAVEGAYGNAFENNSKTSGLLKEFAAKEDMHYIDLLPVIRAYSARGISLHNADRTDHHWNADGHRIVAGEILSFLKAQGWI